MSNVIIFFTSGFDDTLVEIEINDELVESLILTTDYSTGLAYVYNFKLNACHAKVTIQNPEGKQKRELTLMLNGETYFEVDLSPDGELKCVARNEKPVYF